MKPGFGSRWARLPRDARDTLFLLAVIAWTLAPHLWRQPAWCGVLTAVLLLWRGALAWRSRALPGQWVVAGVVLLALGATLWSYRTVLGKEAGVTFAVVLMALKTLELRARRDAFVVFFLGFFLILANFLYTQSLGIAVAMLVATWGLLTALVLAHMPVGQPSLRQAGALALRSALFGAPIMVLLFVLFPRVAPLWGVPQDAAAKTGLSGHMSMGSIAELAVDDSIVMRVRFADGRVPPAPLRYFRGPVLSEFDGREWRSPSIESIAAGRGLPMASLRATGPALEYEITLEPVRLALLPTLEATTRVAPIEGLRTSQRPDLQWRTHRPITERLRYTAWAHTDFGHGPQRYIAELRDYLQLPPEAAPRTRAWARDFAARSRVSAENAGELAQALLQHIRTTPFRYTLEPGVYGDGDWRAAIDEFWLDRREGFCEHYAAAFVVILRALGVPARVVTGYQGTDFQPVDGYYIVRQSYAHAWTEYWQAGAGWVRADPTAAVAPERIDLSRPLAPRPGVIAGAIEGVSPTLLAQLRRAWEAVDNRWNQWVLNYSRSQQLDLLENLGFERPRWDDLVKLLIGAFVALSLAGAGWAWWDRRRADPWARQLAAMRAALRRLGLEARAHEPPRSLAARIRAALGPRGERLAVLLERLDAERYATQDATPPSRAWLRALRAEVGLLCRG